MIEFYVLFNSQGHIRTGPQHCYISDRLWLDAKPANPLGHWGPLTLRSPNMFVSDKIVHY